MEVNRGAGIGILPKRQGSKRVQVDAGQAST
jgi:hypothetical protein